MREEQLDALLKNFRSIADEQMADLTMTPERKERILQACLSPEEKKDAVAPAVLKKKPRPGMRWGSAVAAAAVLLVVALGGAKLFLAGAGSANYNEPAAGEVAPQEAPAAMESAAAEETEEVPAEATVDTETPLMEPDALPTMAPVEDNGQAPAKSEIGQEADKAEPADTVGSFAPAQGQSGSREEPEEAFDEEEFEDEVILTESDGSEEIEEGAVVEEEEVMDEAAGDEGIAGSVQDEDENDMTAGPSAEEPVEEAPPENGEPEDPPTYSSAEVYLSARVVSCDTMALSWVDGQTVIAYGSVAAQAISGEETLQHAVQTAAEQQEEKILEEELIEEAPAWHSTMGYGYVEGENVILHVTTLTVDRVHWGKYLSPGILVKVITREAMTSGTPVTVLLSGTRPELCPANGVMLRFDTVAPYYAMAFTGSSATEIEAVVKALE